MSRRLQHCKSRIHDVEETVRANCKIEENDGNFFVGESVEGTRIKEEDECDGIQIRLSIY